MLPSHRKVDHAAMHAATFSYLVVCVVISCYIKYVSEDSADVSCLDCPTTTCIRNAQCFHRIRGVSPCHGHKLRFMS